MPFLANAVCLNAKFVNKCMYRKVKCPKTILFRPCMYAIVALYVQWVNVYLFNGIILLSV